MLDLIRAHTKMTDALRHNLVRYLLDTSLPVYERWAVFTEEGTSQIMPEWDLGLPCESINSFFLEPPTLEDLKLVSDEVYTYIEVLDKLMDYADSDFEGVVNRYKASTLDDLEYELQDLILRNGYYYVEV